MSHLSWFAFCRVFVQVELSFLSLVGMVAFGLVGKKGEESGEEEKGRNCFVGAGSVFPQFPLVLF